MYKSIIILYLVCFACYIFFTRQPDYLDGEISIATIHWAKDSSAKENIPKAFFSVGTNYYAVDARYVLRDLQEGKNIEVIYEAAKPQKAAVYSWWGYWITAGELVGSVVLFIVLFQVAVAVTKNPTAGSLLEQLDYNPEKKKRYDD